MDAVLCIGLRFITSNSFRPQETAFLSNLSVKTETARSEKHLMKQTHPILKNEQGSVLVLAMVVLVVLTIIGIAATRTSTTELRIAGNEKFYKEAFYSADAGISYMLATAPSVNELVPGPDTEIPSAAKDLDGDDEADVKVFLVKDTESAPRLLEIRSDSQSSRGNVSISAGVQYPADAGPLDDRGNPSDY